MSADTRAAAHDPLDLPALSESLRELARLGEVRRYRKGTLLIQEGDRGDTLFIVLAGRLRAYSSNALGREITYGVYGPGEYIGEMSLDGGPRSASVLTLDPCTCAVVGRPQIERFIAGRPSFAFELLAKVIRRARSATLTARQLALNDVYGRLRDTLLQLGQPMEGAEAHGASGRRLIAERLTHQELAHRLGCSREMVSRLMKDLQHGGYVENTSQGLAILRPLPDRW